VLTVETKELQISEELKRKVDFICKFTNSKPTYFNGSIRSIKGTNIAYVEPHQVKINDIIYLLFDESNKVFCLKLRKSRTAVSVKKFGEIRKRKSKK